MNKEDYLRLEDMAAEADVWCDSISNEASRMKDFADKISNIMATASDKHSQEFLKIAAGLMMDNHKKATEVYTKMLETKAVLEGMRDEAGQQ